MKIEDIERLIELVARHEIGSLEEGKKADLILVDLSKPSMMPVLRDPVRNIVPNLVLSARGDEVVLSIIDGKIIFENGRITTIEEDALLASVQRVAQEVSANAAEQVRKRQTFQHRLTVENKY